MFCRRNHKICQKKKQVCPLPTNWQNRTDSLVADFYNISFVWHKWALYSVTSWSASVNYKLLQIFVFSCIWSPVYCMDVIYFFSKSKSLLLLLWPRQVWQKFPISSEKGGNFCAFWQVFGQQFSCRTSSRTWFIDQPSTTVCLSYW
jgi:hypothetical protein